MKIGNILGKYRGNNKLPEIPMDLESLSWMASWAGTFILVIRGMPQSFKSWKDGHSKGLSAAMLWLWFAGSSLLLPHLFLHQEWLLVSVYVANILCIFVMLKYFYFPRRLKILKIN